ncbi:NACHT domain-containing NTPase [Calothrix sp. FACHB-1219]|uniref:NACHT domain-containing protein n=1 Tax=unclassified Calothrix TaxID=2619626 RepID=UPI0016851E1A|nr:MULTISPECIES: NACHT domain-containing NTPase [unclassified Calothrix]MBD2203891.1 NACHT domain-containing NTPase [Calothrix sp. FACHB-168]MBD2218324.1 NACHT domain-containing NTPase [Calothrix sp. FACHB-1219]
MVKRSLQASHQGIQSAKLALIDKFGTQQKLADALSVTRQPVNKFFNRKPVDSSLFVEICKKLGLEWQEIQENRQSEVKQASEQESDIDALVQEIREQVKPSIKEKCGTMRVLDMPQPIELTGERGIYTNVNILEKITGRRRLDISELLQNSEPDDFERFGLNRVKEKRVPGIEAVQQHQKLMVLGKPGAGKTTFLKYLAMQCIEGQYLTNRVPLFITLKDFAEAPKQPDVLEYIAQQLAFCGVQDASFKADQLLRQGKLLVLLDGLDEVREEDTKRVLQRIRDISDQFHTNQFVITCRIAAKEYTFERFTEVEVSDFDEEQIAIFAQSWFRLSDPVKSERFIQKLKDNEPIHELATNPLLLTLLCLVFGESSDFPTNRSELYKEGVDVLVKKWDAKRNIERDQVYKNLSLHRKLDLLSQIALTTFEQKDYFFKQKTVETYIAEFIYNLRDACTESKELELDSEAILKSIEAQHGLMLERAKGIYSFSHLTFQEYFAAREIVANYTWEILVRHITEKRWKEVFLLSIGMMRKADDFLRLIKREIDAILAGDEKLQQFLIWLNKKSISVKIPYKPSAVRAIYFDFEILPCFNGYYLTLPYALDSRLSDDEELIFNFDYYDNEELREIAIDHNLINCLYNAISFESKHLDQVEAFLYSTLRCVTEFNLQHLLKQLYEQLPTLEEDENQWKNKAQYWAEDLRKVMIRCCDIGYDWQFTDAQKELLLNYYNANELLVNCLNSDCYVSREVRQEIEDNLLLPMSELKKKS